MSAIHNLDDARQRIESIQWNVGAEAMILLAANADIADALYELPLPHDMRVEITVVAEGRAGGETRKDTWLKVKVLR